MTPAVAEQDFTLPQEESQAVLEHGHRLYRRLPDVGVGVIVGDCHGAMAGKHHHR